MSTYDRYIGTSPLYGNFLKQNITPDSTTTIFNLTYVAASEESLLVIDNGLVKTPDVDYTIINSGTQISFAVAPVTGHVVFILYLGQLLLVPTAGTFVHGSILPADISADYNKSLIRKFLMTANTNVVAQSIYFVDTTTTSLTATLPATPEFSDRITFIDLANNFSTNNLTIIRNGENINSLAANYVANINTSIITLDFINNTMGWQLNQTSDPITQYGKIYYFSS